MTQTGQKAEGKQSRKEKRFKKLPKEIQNEKVRKYFDILETKKIILFFKRCFDLFASLILLLLLSPLFFFLAMLIKIDSRGPVFYRQERVTKNGKKFRIFKFRTMIQDADKKGSLITIGQDARITKIGRKIRKCRLDEIPQLLNVLKGDMSFVGTRPEVPKYVEQYTDEMKATLLMRAGITSRASIEYKDEDEIMSAYMNQGKKVDDIYLNKILPEKMKYNLEYIERFSLIEDLKICIKTVI